MAYHCADSGSCDGPGNETEINGEGKPVTPQSRSIRALKILEAVAGADRPMRIADLVDVCALPKATVHRICGLLEKQDYLRQEVNGRGLVPGPKLLHLAQTVFAGRSNTALRHAVLESVARQTGETCNLARPDGTAMLYWDRVETEWPLKVQMPIGTHVPLHCSASGKMYLSSLPPERRRRLIAKLDLVAQTPNSITDPEALERELERIAATQMATDDQEFTEGMIAVAVPVKDSAGRLFATLSIHAPVFRMSLEDAKAHQDLLRAAAAELGTDAEGLEAEAKPGLRAPGATRRP
jgi:IclR family acetate operon transcriptional repressor